jgi:hypothetical protein
VLLPSILVPEPRDLDRDLLPVDSDRSGVVAPSLQGFSRGAVPAVAFPGQGLDLLLKNLLSKEPGHVRVMLEQLEFRVDRLVENVSKRLWNRLLLIRGWRLFGVGAMLSSHRQGFFVGDWFSQLCTGEEPLPCFQHQLTLNIRPRRECSKRFERVARGIRAAWRCRFG